MTTEQAQSLFKQRLMKQLGENCFIKTEAAKDRYGVNTMGVVRHIPLAIRPQQREQVAFIMEAAHEFKIPLYPISTGNNWGYGSANPVVDGCVIIDLSALCALEMDHETGLITIEPGVTQRQLREYLDANDLAFLCPVTGAGPDCSLVGNALERGYGITPYADHFQAVMALEAILPDGSLYRTPLTELGAETVDRAFKWGFGPYLDGLFSQGSFGIVTRMTIALAPRPECVEVFYFGISDDTDLEHAVQAVQRILRTIGGISGSINLMNRRRVLSMMQPYPSTQLGVDGLIPEKLLEILAQRSQIMVWMGAGALYGNTKVVKAARSVVRHELRGIAKRLMFFTRSSLANLDSVVHWLPGKTGRDLSQVVSTLRKSLELLEGTPSTIALPLAYWISGTLPAINQPMHPDRDGCGLQWYSPLVPMQSKRVRVYIDLVERICRAHQVEPLITLTSLSERCFDSTVPLLFSRQDAEATARVQACYEALFHAGLEEGFVPYRASITSMEFYMPEPLTRYWKLVKDLKRTIDPHGLIAPGRYAPLP